MSKRSAATSPRPPGSASAVPVGDDNAGERLRAAEATPPDTPAPIVEDPIGTNLAPPPLRPGYVDRARLFDALTAARDRRVTLVAAPTGYGKTMLLAAWCAEASARGGGASAWLSLDETDNDPARLMRGLIGALRRIGPDIGQHAEAMLQTPGASPMALMRSLVNDLAAAELDALLVFDDFHLITAPACHAIVEFLLDYAPRALHMIISTRSEPPFALGSLRAAGDLAEIRAPELRFTPQEADELLVEREGLCLSEKALTGLLARTEGWPAGLYLAALWLRGRSTPEADAEHFAGDNRYVVDYLSEAVLGRLTDEVREFMLNTSVADRLCASLCTAITGRPAAGMLEDIERSNLFMVPLDDSGTWYRYHHLFHEVLRRELARRHPDRVAVLHCRASAWHRDAGLVAEAVEHATSGRDFDTAAALISEHWREVGRWIGPATVRRWLDGFDSEKLRLYPELGLIGATSVGVVGGSEVEFRRWLELAEQGLSRAQSGRVAGIQSLRAGLSLLRSTFGYRDIAAAVADAEQAVRIECETDGPSRVAALANLGFLLYLANEPAAARRVVSEAIRDQQAQLRPFGYMSALITAALIALDNGDAKNGERTARRALEYVADLGLADNHLSGLAHVALGRALLVAQRPEEARTEMDRAVQLVHSGVIPAQQVYALLWSAPALQAVGDLAGALARVDEAEQVLESFTDAGSLTSLERQARMRIAQARRRRRRPDSLELSEAELAVVRLLGRPGPQREMAQELSVSVNTVKSHTAAIYRKLGVSSRADAVSRASDLGLL
ncbi:MAG TPA: LuxR C-terminal-related transcriptional regulator [Solirubrobacteraceae bacterium]|nr:LuxR C-terminal-related transcriptional regulator [Solirubrobacteraceae bacterium]